MSDIGDVVSTVKKVGHDVAEAVESAIDAASGRGPHTWSRKVIELPNGHLIVEIIKGNGRPLRVVADYPGALYHGRQEDRPNDNDHPSTNPGYDPNSHHEEGGYSP